MPPSHNTRMDMRDDDNAHDEHERSDNFRYKEPRKYLEAAGIHGNCNRFQDPNGYYTKKRKSEDHNQDQRCDYSSSNRKLMNGHLGHGHDHHERSNFRSIISRHHVDVHGCDRQDRSDSRSRYYADVRVHDHHERSNCKNGSSRHYPSIDVHGRDRHDRSDSRLRHHVDVHVRDHHERSNCKNGRSRHDPIHTHGCNRHERSNCRLRHHMDVHVHDHHERSNCKIGRSRHDPIDVHGRDCHERSNSTKSVSRNHMEVRRTRRFNNYHHPRKVDIDLHKQLASRREQHDLRDEIMKIRLKKVEDSMRIKELVNSSQQYRYEHLTAHASASRHEWEKLQCRWTEENQAEINRSRDYLHKKLASVIHKRESSPEEGEFVVNKDVQPQPSNFITGDPATSEDENGDPLTTDSDDELCDILMKCYPRSYGQHP